MFAGQDSSVGKPSRYGLDSPAIESRWGRHFPPPSRPALGPNQPSCTMGTGYFPGVKRPERGVDQPPHLAPRLILGVYLYYHSGLSWPVLG